MIYYEEAKQSKRELIFSYLSGIIFAIGWWLWIDSVAYKNSKDDPVSVTFGHWIPGIVGTIGLIMINSVSWTNLQGFGFNSDDSTQSKARIWLLVSFTICFSGVIASIWIAIQHWFNEKELEHTNWPGAAIILQNVFIFVSGILYRFSKKDTSDNIGFM